MGLGWGLGVGVVVGVVMCGRDVIGWEERRSLPSEAKAGKELACCQMGGGPFGSSST